MSKNYFVYILSNQKRGTLYVGVTNDIARRISEHREGTGSRFARRYGIHRLVYSEIYEDVRDAIVREKALKKWKRDWKVQLIESANPDWKDLQDTLNR